MDDVLTSVHGKPITVRDVVDFLKASGHFRTAIYGAIEIEVIKLKARGMGIEASAGELREHSEMKKRWMGLHSAQHWHEHCRWLGIDDEQWEKMVRTEVLRKKLQQRAIGAADIKRYFSANRARLATVRLSRIVCTEEAQAAHLAEHVRQRPDNFAAMARQHSVEEQTRDGAGYLGSFSRGILPEAIERTVFGAAPGDVLGPFSENGRWSLYRVEGFDHTELDEAQRTYIAERLFSEWLRHEVETVSA